jgi:putative MFS transporter
MLCGFGGAACVALAGLLHNEIVAGVSLFWLFIVIGDFFYDGGFAIIGPYMAEVWPTRLRTSGMGSAYGFGGIGKIIGPLGLALIVGSSNVVKPEVTLAAITPSFLYLAAWLVLCGCAFLFFGFETRHRSISAIDSRFDGDPAEAGP